MPQWLQALVRSDLVLALRSIGEAVIIAYAAAWAVTLVNGFVLRSGLSDDIRVPFIYFHELMNVFICAWLALISVGQIVVRTSKRLLRDALAKPH